MALFYYLAPRDMVTLYAVVSGASIDSAHQNAWLCDGRPNRPVLGTSGTASWTITPTAGSVNFVAAANTNVDPGGVINVSGGVTASLVSSVRADFIRHNPWKVITPVSSPGNITVGVTGNSSNIRLGEFFAGNARQLTYGTKPGADQEKEYRVVMPDRWSSVPGYDVKQDRYRKNYEIICNLTEFAEVEAWEQSTYRGTRPSVIVPDVDRNDCFVVKFMSFSYRKLNPGWYEVTLNLLEYPRTQW